MGSIAGHQMDELAPRSSLQGLRYWRTRPSAVDGDSAGEWIKHQWEFQDPEMEVRWYHMFGHILEEYPKYPLT